ncbi:metallophosphoesterase [Specibacter sp. AOP5-B1-6]|uniref:metallophosphoesterase n=1 Tax=Specibacter sp. AOP5-B1-6 TaxID=3457653 RepID=UPI00402B14BF
MTTLRILHLSDTHLMGDGTLHGGVVDTVAAYRCTLDAFENAGPLDLVVLSGDVSDDGSPASYSTLRSLTGDFAARHGAVAVYAMGNHDQRGGFRAVLGSGHPGSGHPGTATVSSAADTSTPAGVEMPIFGVSEVAGYRIITVDSSVPGRTHGHVDAAQLEWLRAQLATNSGHGTVVVVHHPPVEPVTALHQGIELINPDELADALAGSDTVAILSGHYHHHLTDVLAAGSGTIPVVVTSGVVNSNDVLAPAGHERAGAGSGGTLITLSALPGGEMARPAMRVRTLPVRIHLPPEVSPELVFDLAPPAVAGISAAIAVAPAELLAAGFPAPLKADRAVADHEGTSGAVADREGASGV